LLRGFSSKNPEAKRKFITFCFNTVSYIVFALVILAASCGLGAAHHNQLGATAPFLTQATKPPAVELIEFFQRSNEPDTAKPKSFETEHSPFLGSLLTMLAGSGKK